MRIKITNPLMLPFSSSSYLTRAPRNKLSSSLPNNLNSFVSVYKDTRQGAITSPTLFNNGVLDA